MDSEEVIRADDIRAVAIRVLNGIPNSFREASSGRISTTTLNSVLVFLQHEWYKGRKGYEMGSLDDNVPDLKKVLVEVQSQITDFQKDDMINRAIVLQVWLTKNTCDLAACLSQRLERGGLLRSDFNEHDLGLVYGFFENGQDLARSAHGPAIARTAESHCTSRWCGEMMRAVHLSRNDDSLKWVYAYWVWADFGGQRQEPVPTEQDSLSAERDGSVRTPSLSGATDAEFSNELVAQSCRSGSSFSSLVEKLDAALRQSSK